jgi:xanthine dehydrogenase YagR molybdenum-binding subunit
VQFCEVRVDAKTGETRVSRWVGVFDIGRVLNAKTAASQLRGGIVMGLGMAMAEETLVDARTGRIMNPSLAEYHVPVHADVPLIDVSFLDDPDPRMPFGILGAGEVGVTGVGSAVANAVHHATGKRVRGPADHPRQAAVSQDRDSRSSIWTSSVWSCALTADGACSVRG